MVHNLLSLYGNNVKSGIIISHERREKGRGGVGEREKEGKESEGRREVID